MAAYHKPMTLPLLDTQALTLKGETLRGHRLLTDMPRLADLLLDTDGGLDWQLSGRSELRADGSRQAFMSLGLQGELVLRCVRCLEPVRVTLDETRPYRLVPDEAQAAREDNEDDEHDLLVSSRRFDLAGLLEDEVIMALPPAPRHADCRAPAPRLSDVVPASPANLDSPEPASQPNPFAALAALRRQDK